MRYGKHVGLLVGVVLGVAVAIAIGGCGERAPAGGGDQVTPPGDMATTEQRHEVVLTDLRGERIAAGEFGLPESLEGEFEGAWSLSPDAAGRGLPSGAGRLAGRSGGDDIWIVLKQDGADQSVEALISTRPEFNGIWYITTDAGSDAGGYIVAPAKQAELAPVAAKLASADQLIAAGEGYQALFVLEEIIAEHPESPMYVLAVQREVEIGAAALRGPEEVEGGAGHEEGVDIMLRAVERLPRSATAMRAMSELGEHFGRVDDAESAMIVYERMLALGVSGDVRDEAERRLQALSEGR